MNEITDILLMPSYKFGEQFDRLSVLVDFTGCTSALLIENKMRLEVNRARALSKTSKNPWQRERWGLKAERLDVLIEQGFPERAIREAIRYPRGMIAQTLLHGRAEARRIIQAQKAAAARALLRLGAPSTKTPERRPESRRIPTYRRWWRRK